MEWLSFYRRLWLLEEEKYDEGTTGLNKKKIFFENYKWPT